MIATFCPVLALTLALGGGFALGDKIHLKDGRVLDGKVLEEKDGRILLKMKLGSVWIDKARIQRIEKERPSREVYLERKAALSRTNSAGWVDLGRFCLENGLAEEAKECFDSALTASPDLPEARAELNRLLSLEGLSRLLKAQDEEEVRQAAVGLSRLGPIGLGILKEALDKRDRAIRALEKKPATLLARIRGEFIRLRDTTLNNIRNERHYTDKNEKVRESILERVRTLQQMHRDPGNPTHLRLHLRLAVWMFENDRIVGALEAFGAPGKKHIVIRDDPLLSLSKRVSSDSFLDEANRHRKANEVVAGKNAKTAKSLDISRLEIAGIEAINDYRELMGLKRLKIDPRLRKAAMGHSRAMAEKGFFSHLSPLAGLKTPYARIRKAGYDFQTAAENIARKKDGLTAAGALCAWIASPGHHRALVHSELEDLGLGIHGIYWTLNMGKHRKAD
jgi:uncharacterized protein YkwD